MGRRTRKDVHRRRELCQDIGTLVDFMFIWFLAL
jgi:hypothetical protein